MAIRGSRFYNDPSIGQAFDNLASLFAPPDSADMANYALANERNTRNEIVAQLKSDPRYAGFDYQAILADLYDPTASFRSVEMDDATTRRGQDITAATSRANNLEDNRAKIITDAFGTLSPGEIRPAIPANILGGYDLPGLDAVAGTPKPLSETELDAILKQDLIKKGALTQDDLVAQILGDVPVENVVGPDGQPVITRRSDAVGMEPYFNKGAEAKPQNAVAALPDGRTVPAIQGQDGGWLHAQTGERLPDDIRIFDMPKAQGTAADVGLSKPTDTYIEKQLIDITIAKDTASKLRDLVANAPASQGIVGLLRGTAQNLVQTGGELGEYFGGGVAEVAKDIENGLADASLAGAFDPNIPAIDMMANLLAFQYAKTTTGERLSNEMLRAAKAALGLDGLDANQANSLARIDQAIKMIGAQEGILRGFIDQGIGGGTPPAAAPAAATPMPTADGVPEGVDPEDWKYLTEAERAEFLNGN